VNIYLCVNTSSYNAGINMCIDYREAMVIKKTFLSVISSHIISKLLNKLVLSVPVYNSILACSLSFSSKV